MGERRNYDQDGDAFAEVDRPERRRESGLQLLGQQREWTISGYVIVRVGSGLLSMPRNGGAPIEFDLRRNPPPACHRRASGECMAFANGTETASVRNHLRPSGADCTSTVEIMKTPGKSMRQRPSSTPDPDPEEGPRPPVDYREEGSSGTTVP